jgi:hypothetical protein
MIYSAKSIQKIWQKFAAEICYNIHYKGQMLARRKCFVLLI